MSLPPLTVIPAGAGSGKTHTIEQRLGAWIGEGLVRPDGIVAVTFTEAAARELRERIRARLVALGRLDDAMRLDHAYISTIHGFGVRLLAEFAFENGTSPRPRLLNDDEQNVLVRQAIAQAGQVAAITRDLARYGYTYDHNDGSSPEDVFRREMAHLVGLLRAMGWDGQSPVHAARAARRVADRYGPTLAAAPLNARLHRAVLALLEAFPASFADAFPSNQSACAALRRDFGNLCDARDPERIARDWTLWAELAELRGSKRGSQLPPAYDALADAVREAAAALAHHPGPCASAQTQIRALIDAAQDVLVDYAAAKRAAGLVDYADMIALAHALLARHPAVLATLLGRIDCLVVDEFQDTNPLQFALVWQLHRAGVPTLLVGDMKQAIMGFQGADPRLFGALQAAHPAQLEPLRRNWRSQPAIMEFVNAIGAELFPGAYTALAAQAPARAIEALEVLHFATSTRSGFHRVRAHVLGERVQALLADPGVEIVDRHRLAPRRLRGSDIAVLCPTHGMLAEYAHALRAQGLQVQLEQQGWYASRAVQLALAALAYVAHPADRHAALYLAVTELGPLSLEAGLRTLVERGAFELPLLARLERLAEQSTERTVYTLVADTLTALELFDTVQSWPGARAERANLLRLLAEAGEFMDAQREALAYGGYHGAGLPTFLAWLAGKREREDTMPAAAVLDEHAIELVTWHSAKGREWPVVALGGLERKLRASLPQLALGYAEFRDLATVLDTATIDYSPKFAARATCEQFLAPLQEQMEIDARRVLYVALTRAREKLIVEWPAYQIGGDAVSYCSILGASGLAVARDALLVHGQRFPCRVIEADVAAAEQAVAAGPRRTANERLIGFGRRAIRRRPAPAQVRPDAVTASALAGCAPASARAAAREDYAPRLPLEPALGGAVLGTRLHRCFEILGARPAALAAAAGVLGLAPDTAAFAAIRAQVAAFEQWLARRFAGAEVLREWPVLALRADGSVLSGSIDVLVRRGADAWVIDHKSDRVDGARDTALGHYAGQLRAYGEALAAQGLQVRGLGLDWIRAGVVDWLDVAG